MLHYKYQKLKYMKIMITQFYITNIKNEHSGTYAHADGGEWRGGAASGRGCQAGSTGAMGEKEPGLGTGIPGQHGEGAARARR